MKSPAQIIATLKKLHRLYQNPGALHVGTPYHMLVMVMLSARTRDEQILKLAPKFFARFPTIESLAIASISEIVDRVNTIGMYKQKAKHLSAMAKNVVEFSSGRVPGTMEGLTALPGVGRKTASVLLAARFNTPAIAVDTHVFRVVNRLGWVKTKTVEATERALLTLIPKSMHHIVNQVFVPFGRTICVTTPRCWTCPIRDECPFDNKDFTVPKNAGAILKKIDVTHENIQNLKNILSENFPPSTNSESG